MIYKITIETRSLSHNAESNHILLMSGSSKITDWERADAMNYKANQGIARCIRDLKSYGANVVESEI